MIKISHKEDCCGCNACVQRCPRQCITMQEDKEGFLYPVIKKEECTNCGLCEKVCPVINQGNSQEPIKTYAAINPNNDVRIASSSGGVFTVLAEETINNNGVVFGAAFNKEWNVEHTCVENINDLEKLRGSKYVQSNIGNSYQEAERFLKEGREVLFSGTPCQIAALKLFLRKEYKKLTTIDFVCHGVPSPAVWRKYLQETIEKIQINRAGKNSVSGTAGEGTCIKSIAFRSKSQGWKKYSFSIQLNFPNDVEKNTVFFQETLHENTYMQCFLNDLCLRPSCYHCPARCGKSGSDITLADLWGASEICPELDDDKGLSLVMLRNGGINLTQIDKWEISYNDALAHNPSIEKSVATPAKRKTFFKKMNKKGVYKATAECLQRGKISVIAEKVMWNIKHRLLK